MKTWEMIKELTENPSKRFTYDTAAKGSYVTIKNRTASWHGPGQDGQILSVNIANEGWEEFKSPVSFMEAVKAQKPIRVEHDITDGDEELDVYLELDYFLECLAGNWYECEVRDVLLNGKFYIED